MLDALLAGVIVDEAGALVRDFDARTIGCRRRRAATGGTAYRLHRQMETRHRRALPCHSGAWRGRSPAGVEGDPLPPGIGRASCRARGVKPCEGTGVAGT